MKAMAGLEVSSLSAQAPSNRVCLSLEQAIMEKGKIAMAFMQVLTTSLQEFPVTLPPFVSRIASAFSIVSFDFFALFSVGCVVEVNYYGALLSTVATPVGLALLVFLYATYRARRYIKDRQKESASKGGIKTDVLQNNKEVVRWQPIFTQIYLVVLFCIYPGVSRKILTTFKCEDFYVALPEPECTAEKGLRWREGIGTTEVEPYACYSSFLRDDLSLSCNSSKHAAWEAFAAVAFVFYPLGVPALFAWLLLRARRSGVDEGGNRKVNSIAFIQPVSREATILRSKNVFLHPRNHSN